MYIYAHHLCALIMIDPHNDQIRPAPSWPDSSTGRALLSDQHCRARSGFQSCLGLPCIKQLRGSHTSNLRFNLEFKQIDDFHVSPMWPGFDSQIRRHMWVEFVGSQSYSATRGFLRVLRFPLSSKTSI